MAIAELFRPSSKVEVVAVVVRSTALFSGGFTWLDAPSFVSGELSLGSSRHVCIYMT
jgi:hypothetical protein